MEELVAPDANMVEDCITVVIPTILKTTHEVFQYTLNQLSSLSNVKRIIIIIIDNTENKDFDKQYTLNDTICVS